MAQIEGGGRRRGADAHHRHETTGRRQPRHRPTCPPRSGRPTTGAACAGRSAGAPTARQHRESLPTREAAEARAAELNDDIRSGRYVDPRGGNRTLDEVFPLWLADHTGVRPATIDNYIRHYNGMVRPRFGSTRIGDIDERAVKAWVADLDSGAIRTKYGEPYTKGAIKTGVRRLSAAMSRYAVRRRWILADPTAGVRCPARPCNVSTRSPRPRRAPSPTRPESSAPRPAGRADGPWTASSSCSSPPPACAQARWPPSTCATSTSRTAQSTSTRP